MKKKDTLRWFVFLAMVVSFSAAVKHIKYFFHAPRLIGNRLINVLIIVIAFVLGSMAYSVKNIRQKIGFYCIGAGFFLEGIIYLTRGQYLFSVINLLTILAFSLSFFTLLYDFVLTFRSNEKQK